MTSYISSSNTNSIITAIDRLRSCCQVNTKSNWMSLLGDREMTEVLTSNLLNWQPVQLNDKANIPWSAGQEVLWLKQKFIIPENLHGYLLTELSLRLSLLWWADAVDVYVNGKLVLSGDLFDCSPRVLLTGDAKPGEEFSIVLRLVSPGHCEGALVRSLLIFESPDYNKLDPGFVADELAIVQEYLEQYQPEDLPKLTTAVEKAFNHPDWEQLLSSLHETLSLTPIPQKFKINLLGHAHLDLAWLWPVAETWTAAQNTFESVLKLQVDFPELVFCHSTPALYAWIEEHRPDLFAEIQNRVKSGKWEIFGGFWVEPDLNLPAGESLVRQLLYGQKYFQAKFGKISPIVWVPDTFGFCATLPQFLVNAGIEYFVTQKLRWNDTTKFNYGWFWWRSLDGSQILSYMSAPIGEGIDPVRMFKYACEWEQQTDLQTSLWLPGVGDHGGGPTRDMLETARKWQHSPVFPQIEFTTAEKYLQDIKTPNQNLPVWEDELYLEFHRGCYTTHADQKQYNRFSERLLYQAELFATLASVFCKVTYPKTEIETAWKQVLFNQFHDILPGSSITQVYEDALPEWKKVQEVSNKILQNSLEAIASHIKLPQPPQPQSIPVIIFNSLNWERCEVVTLTPPNNSPNWELYNIDGEKIPTQPTPQNTLKFLASPIPSIGYQIFWLSPTSQTPPALPTPENWIIENEHLRVEVNPQTGDLTSIFDKTQQQEILAGPGNQLQAFTDKGQYWDAWNIDPNYQQHPLPPAELKSIQWLNYGIVEKSVRVVRQIGTSEFCQDYILQTNCPILKIHNTINWQESQVLVKTAFPLQLSAEIASYEIPCGVIRRPTNPQTPAEQAKWEVPALNWADLTAATPQGFYGVSLLNNCKYGYDAKPNQIRLTLLRSPNWPDPNADRGIHEFTYAVYPHTDTWETAQTVKRGYELNTPLQVIISPPANSESITAKSFLNFSAENLICMALKPAEDNPEKIILRFYECHGKNAELSLQSDFDLTLGNAVDLLERPHPQTPTIPPWKIASFEVITGKRVKNPIISR
ncbi:MAG TPA: alpha-mannosidase [Nostocaceae cyanobacterium]|nr:alpha-mannosidase [Nostocaceae cyanobacterium]